MTTKKQGNDDIRKSPIEEIDLDTLSDALEHFEIEEDIFDEAEAEAFAKSLEAGEIEDDFALDSLEEIGALKRDRGIKKMPVNREDDKRRLGK